MIFRFILFALPLSLFGTSIIGGLDNGSTDPYAALVTSSGSTIPLTGGFLPIGEGSIDTVAINASGMAIIGGQHKTTEPYVALVGASGAIIPILGSIPAGDGRILSVAINASGVGIIGGTESSTAPYLSLVTPVGSSPIGVTVPKAGSLPTAPGEMCSVAINDSGLGIIGGFDNANLPYVSHISPEGFVTLLTGGALPTGQGQISSVSINASGAGIVGGQDNSSLPYIALVSPSGVTTGVSGSARPLGNGDIRSVAINDSGAGIIGGFHTNAVVPYVALVSPSGVLTALSGSALPKGTGQVSVVAINASGAAIIGGRDVNLSTPYAAFVSPLGVTSPITGDVLTGTGGILSVAIDDSGIALIGGTNAPYVAIVAPSGKTHALTGPGLPLPFAAIGSVAGVGIFDAVIPKSFGAANSYANPISLLASQLLPNHSSIAHKVPLEKKQKELSLLTDAKDKIKWSFPTKKDTNYSIWGSFFGDYAHQKKEGKFSDIANWITGFLLAFDYEGVENALIGGGFAYAYNYAHLSESVGHAKTHQELFTVYGSWTHEHFYINLALWGGPYQLKNERHALGIFTSNASINGGFFSPHLEVSSPFYAKKDWFLIDPFAMFDWTNNWQGRVRESGPSGFNVNIKSQYTSLLRSELGFRFFETLSFDWGNLILLEKGSFVNKSPFSAGSSTAFFTGSASSFSIEVFSNESQNLGVVQFKTQFAPKTHCYPYGSINYQGEFGSSFQSHLISLEVGKDF